MSDSELVPVPPLPCPFCGGEAGVSPVATTPKTIRYRVSCAVEDGGCCASSAVRASEAEAIEAWNTRASEAQVKVLAEALERAHTELAALIPAECLADGGPMKPQDWPASEADGQCLQNAWDEIVAALSEVGEE